MSPVLREITIAHTPDADDAFMFYGLTSGIIKPTGISIAHKLLSMQYLNEAAISGKYEMSALSFATYPQILDTYYLMTCGACMGYKTGPILIAKDPIDADELLDVTIAVPGTMTSAYLILKIFFPQAETISVPFDGIITAIQEGTAQVGLVIDGGQMTYAQLGLYKIADLGGWWFEETGLPLPLGGNIIRKDLPRTIIFQLTQLFRQSIQYALDHRQEAIRYAMRYAQGMSEAQAQKFVGRYVNQFTLDYGEQGRLALIELFNRGHAAGILPQFIKPEFAERL